MKANLLLDEQLWFSFGLSSKRLQASNCTAGRLVAFSVFRRYFV
jgi:hypothetical protein